VVMNSMCGMLRRGSTANSLLVFAGLAVAACILASEGALADEPSRDGSRDTSDENENDAVFRSIQPLEAAVMPVSLT